MRHVADTVDPLPAVSYNTRDIVAAAADVDVDVVAVAVAAGDAQEIAEAENAAVNTGPGRLGDIRRSFGSAVDIGLVVVGHSEHQDAFERIQTNLSAYLEIVQRYYMMVLWCLSVMGVHVAHKDFHWKRNVVDSY